MNRLSLFKIFSAIIFSLAVFTLLIQKIIIGYSLVVLGYYFIRKSDEIWLQHVTLFPSYLLYLWKKFLIK